MPIRDPFTKLESQAMLRQSVPGVYSANSPIDWSGNLVPNSQPFYSPIRQQIDGESHYALVPNPAYNGGAVTPAAPPPQFQFSFDTTGQVIPRSIGTVRLPIKPIWVLGIVESGDPAISNTQTFAGAVCAPIDEDEEGEVGRYWAGGSLIYDAGGAVQPAGMTDADFALLTASLSSVVMYPGNETQLPDPTIVLDKGADRTNAFRGIRYFVFPNYPVSNGLPQLSVEFSRTNEQTADTGAVDFLTGAG